LPRDAATRQQSDRVVAEEPARAFGRVARVGVLRQQHHEPAFQPLVQRPEQERQCRLRYAGARRQRVGELDEALVLYELPDEGMKYRTVHDEGRNSRSARLMVFVCECAGTSAPSTTSSPKRLRT